MRATAARAFAQLVRRVGGVALLSMAAVVLAAADAPPLPLPPPPAPPPHRAPRPLAGPAANSAATTPDRVIAPPHPAARAAPAIPTASGAAPRHPAGGAVRPHRPRADAVARR